MGNCAKFRAGIFGSVAAFGFACATTQPASPQATNAATGQTPDAPGDAAKAAAKIETAKMGTSEFSAGEFTTNDFVKVRKGPGMKFDVVRVLGKGKKISSMGVENAIWVKIAEGEYIPSKFLGKM